MFGKNRSQGSGGSQFDNVLNTIARGTVIEGVIHAKGDIRIEGQVNGSVFCESKVVLGEHGRVEGDIEARNAHIAGRVKGNLKIKELLQLQEKGKIEGDISTIKLSIQVGAVFTGNCRMASGSGHSENKQRHHNISSARVAQDGESATIMSHEQSEKAL
jgi:cytoskeletal protein CcmA (bactofilin family)